MPDKAEPDFFVGYLPLPPRLKHFLLGTATALTVLVVLAALVLARSTQGASRGHFAFAQSRGVLGVFSALPTPVLWTLDPAAPSGVRGTLLVRQGKFGLSAKAAELDGHAVRVDGASIERDGQRMLELSAMPVLADAELPAAQRSQIMARSSAQLGETSLVGEIVDSKCYLGRMRPGDQRTHRACAQLCIAGGIPPLLVVHDAHGAERSYLLAARDGGPIFQAILPFVAEPVRISGSVTRDGDTLVLRTDVAHIERL
jgi:hypothetical protein